VATQPLLVLGADVTVRQGDGLPTTVVHGASELRVKESDRVATVAAGLRAIGVEVDEHPDGWTIHGRAGRVRGGTVDAAGDHRIAMAFMVAGLATREGVTVVGAESARLDPGSEPLAGLFVEAVGPRDRRAGRAGKHDRPRRGGAARAAPCGLGGHVGGAVARLETPFPGQAGAPRGSIARGSCRPGG
jgi:hypothetical protein